jgi:hypothetical protein
VTPRVLLHLGWATIATGVVLLEVVWPASTNPGDWVWPLGLAPIPLAGALILSRVPGNRIGGVLTTVGAASAFVFGGGRVAMTWFDEPWSPYLEALLAPVVVVTFWGLMALLYLLPTGESLPGWPRWAFRAATAVVLGVAPLLFWFRPGPLDLSTSLDGVEGRDNPLGFGPEWVGVVADAAFGVVVVAALVGVAAFLLRFRTAVGVEKAQLKVFLFGVSSFVGLLVIVSLSPEDTGASPWDPLLAGLVIAGFWGLPASVVAAVLRYRLWDIDRLVGRTITYAVVVAFLGGAYAGLVVALGSLLPVSGDLPVAISTLVVALASLPLVRRVQRVVDRRFFRSRYDAGVVVARVADELRGSLDLGEVTGRVGSVVDEVFAPVSVGVWVADEHSGAG